MMISDVLVHSKLQIRILTKINLGWTKRRLAKCD